jgi:hypothetical protein
MTNTEEKDAFTCEGLPNATRQKYARELSLPDTLCDCLHYPFALKVFNLDELKQTDFITKNCWLIYRVLKHIVQDNRLNEEYCAQWISMFFQ